MVTSVEKMATLRPAFKKDGTVTAGNASGINDAAAGPSSDVGRQRTKDLGLKPLVKIRAFSYAGMDPAYMGLGPIPAVRKLLQKENLTINDFGANRIKRSICGPGHCLRAGARVRYGKKPTRLAVGFPLVIPLDVPAHASP